MKTTIPIFCMLALLLIGSGCTDTEDSPANLSANETPAIILYYENGNVSVPVNVSQIEVRDPGNFTANVTSVITILLDDPRTGILLENGWNITSVAGKTDEHDPNLAYADVEFEKEGLSFFIGVDEAANRTLAGYCDAKYMVRSDDFTQIGLPTPRYHQAQPCGETKTFILDNGDDPRNPRLVMIYDRTTIFYLYPSYAIIDMTGILD